MNYIAFEPIDTPLGAFNDVLHISLDIQITPPSLRVRDQLRDCQIERIAHEKGLISPQTWSLRLGLDYDQEQKNIAMHRQDTVPVAGGQK